MASISVDSKTPSSTRDRYGYVSIRGFAGFLGITIAVGITLEIAFGKAGLVRQATKLEEVRSPFSFIFTMRYYQNHLNIQRKKNTFDIRSWFLKSFEVSIPVLKIMGNDTMEGLAELVVGQVSPNLLPEMAAIKKAPRQGSTAASDEDSTASSVGDSTESVSAESSDVSLDYGDLSFEFNEASTGASTPIRGKSVSQPVKIDWNKEISLPHAALISTDKSPAARPSVIVLTGVSGLLGSHLLSRLLQDSSVKEIICIAVRRLRRRLQSNEFPMDKRITYFEGNLEDALLGLSADEPFYPAIKTANAGSTKELISLCMTRKIPIHFLSTVGVALLGSFESFPEISVADSSPPLDGSHGYIAAKWASERMLENLYKEHGVNVWIHRPSTIIREGERAENAAAQVDWMNALVAYMRKTKAVPAMQNLRGALDLVYADKVTDSILTCVFENSPKSPLGGPNYLHQTGEFVQPLDQLKEFVERTLGVPDVQVLLMEQWAARAVAMGLNRGIAASVEAMDEPGQPHYPRMLRDGADLDKALSGQVARPVSLKN
ncbi:NAD(P)-binding protein [Colletotrichum zoysiae]|uniref:NAD(P)-binding protein n=1 Tax=Colletotrichum zoysiae TaxID=1216348 RepID=A0AAD9HTY0_9PEZI|nr:NAD(P)-binding protein [Colletotrichum zoysiae]